MDWTPPRKFDLAEALGNPEDAKAYVKLQQLGVRRRSPTQQEKYKRLQKRYQAFRRAQMFARAARAPDAPAAPGAPEAPVEPDPRQLTLEGTSPAPEVAPAPPASPEPDEVPDAGVVQEVAPPPADDKQDDKHADAGEVLQAPPPADSPEVIGERERWVRKRIRTALEGWAGWLRSWGVWAPPAWVEKEAARLGSTAVEAFGVLDRKPSKWVALGGALGSVTLLWGTPSLFAIRRWRDGAERKQPQIVDEGKEPTE